MRFSRDMSQIVENVLSCNVEESFRKFLDPYPDADDFKNVISSSLSKDTSLITIFVLRKVTKRQRRDKQQDRHVIIINVA